MKALDACRAAGDQSLLATVYGEMGTLFAVQGRYDAALKAQQEALNTYRKLNDRTYLMVAALSGYGHTLSAVGNEAEGRKSIEEALQLAVEAKNDATTAEALNFLGDSYFYAGDFTSAASSMRKRYNWRPRRMSATRCYWQNWISPNLMSRRTAPRPRLPC